MGALFRLCAPRLYKELLPLNRMRAHRTEVMLIGRIRGLSGDFSRLDAVEEVSQIPSGFAGDVWTDRIDIIGPAVQKQNGGSP